MWCHQITWCGSISNTFQSARYVFGWDSLWQCSLFCLYACMLSSVAHVNISLTLREQHSCCRVKKCKISMWPLRTEGALLPHQIWHVTSVFKENITRWRAFSVELSLPGLRLMSVVAGIRTPDLPHANDLPTAPLRRSQYWVWTSLISVTLIIRNDGVYSRTPNYFFHQIRWKIRNSQSKKSSAFI